MPVYHVPDVGAQAAWMRSAMLVLALAESGEPGVEGAVPGASILPPGRATQPLLIEAP